LLTHFGSWKLPSLSIKRRGGKFIQFCVKLFKPRKKKAPGVKVSEGIADLIFALIVYVVFMIQASLVKALPLEGVNSALYFLHVSLLHAWTAFEYKWYPMGIGKHKLIRV
jgi:hypothetical protein